MRRLANLAVFLLCLPAPAVGASEASGQLTVNGVSIPIRHAYVQQELDDEGEEILVVLLREQPLRSDLLDGENFLETLLPVDSGSGLRFVLHGDGEAWNWRFVHPSFGDGGHGVGYATSLRVEVDERSEDRLRGRAFTTEPGASGEHRYDFDVDFEAEVLQPEAYAPPPGTPGAVAEARKRLRQMGYRFKPEDFAMSFVDPEVLRLYLDAGMDTETVLPDSGRTLLQVAMSWNCVDAGRESIRTLVEAGADVNRPDPDGNPPLFAAYRCPEVLEELLDAGAELDAQTSVEGERVGQSLMRRALTFDEPEVVRVLLRRGYDVAGESEQLLEWARSNPELVEMVEEAGAVAAEGRETPQAADSEAAAGEAWAPTSTPLEASRDPRDAAQAKAELESMGLPLNEEGMFLRLLELDVNAVLLYLEAGVSPNIRDNWASKYTPLRHAIGACAYQSDMIAIAQVVEGLLTHGAVVDDADEYGRTPLMEAAQYCPSEIVQRLLAGGATLSAVSRSGDTAMSSAVMHGKAENVAVLIEAGFDVAADSERLLRLAEGKPAIQERLRSALQP